MSRPRFDRPPGPAGRSTSSTSTPSSAARPQYSGDSSGWHSNQPGGYSSNYRPPGPAGRGTSSKSTPSSAARPQYSGDSSGWHSNQPGGYSSNYRPPGPAGRGTSSTSTPSSAAWPQYSGDSPGWHSNQPGGYSSNFSGTGKSSAAMPWTQPNKPNSASFTSQSSETYATPNQFSANPPVMSGHQQQTSLSSQVQPAVSKSDDGAIPCQPSPASGGAYGWNNNAAAGQWQTQSQWPWPQNDNQWPSSQPFQYTVCYLCVYWLIVKDWSIWLNVSVDMLATRLIACDEN